MSNIPSKNILAKHEDDISGTPIVSVLWEKAFMSILCVVTAQIQFLDTLSPISRVGAVVVQRKFLHRILAFLEISPERGMVVLRAKMVEVSAF